MYVLFSHPSWERRLDDQEMQLRDRYNTQRELDELRVSNDEVSHELATTRSDLEVRMGNAFPGRFQRDRYSTAVNNEDPSICVRDDSGIIGSPRRSHFYNFDC